MEQRLTVSDTVSEVVHQRDTVREQVVVYDTVREKTTIHLNAEGDTTRREMEREHISDRTREHATASQQTATSQQSHQAEQASTLKETVAEQPRAWRPFKWGVVAGFLAGITGTIGIHILIRKFSK